MVDKIYAGLKLLGNALKLSGEKLIAFISTASLPVLIRVGLIAGVCVAVILLIFKFIKDKRASYKKAQQSPADEGLKKNYHDSKNQKDLDSPVMKKVKKQLRKDFKVRSKGVSRKRPFYGRKTPKVKRRYEKLYNPEEIHDKEFESEEEERLYRQQLEEAREEIFSELEEFYRRAHDGEFIWDPNEEPDYDADPCSLMNLWDDL